MRVMEIPTIRENMSFIGVLFEYERVVPEKQKSGLLWLRLGINLLPGSTHLLNVLSFCHKTSSNGRTQCDGDKHGKTEKQNRREGDDQNLGRKKGQQKKRQKSQKRTKQGKRKGKRKKGEK
jgi:hypothetical protein